VTAKQKNKEMYEIYLQVLEKNPFHGGGGGGYGYFLELCNEYNSSIYCKNMLVHYFVLELCSSKLTVFFELCSGKTFGFLEQIMSVNNCKYACIFVPNEGFC